MDRVLLAAHPTVGHVNALVTIGSRLRAAGADVRFAIPWLRVPGIPLPGMLSAALRLPRVIEAAGLRVVPLPAHAKALAYAVAMPWAAGAAEARLAGLAATSGATAYVRHLEAELAREPADVIVADFAFFAAQLAAERLRVPFVAFFHSGLPFPSGGRYPFTGGAALARTVDARLARARRTLGMSEAPPGMLDRPYSPDLNLLATAPALEGDPLDFGPLTRAVGPCIDGRVEDDAGAFPLHRLRPDARKVYVSLGTVFNGRPDRFRKLIAGLVAPGVQLVVSAGASFAAIAKLSGPDLLVLPRVPQLAVLRAVDYVVSHGGNNTVNETLLAGRPLLVMPIGGEQEANARRVEHLGAGIALDRVRLSPERVREAFSRLSSTPSYAERARAIAEATAGLKGAAETSRLVLELARGRRASA